MNALISESRRDRRGPLQRRINTSKTENLIRYCPNPACGVSIMKTDGCLSVTCTRCYAVMCYTCRIRLVAPHSHWTQTTCRHFVSQTADVTDEGRDIRERTEAEEQTIREFITERPELVYDQVKRFLSFGYDYSTVRNSAPVPPGTGDGTPTLEGLRQWEEALRRRETANQGDETEGRQRKTAIQQSENTLRQREMAVQNRENGVRQRESVVQRRETIFQENETAFHMRETQVRDDENRVQERETAIHSRETSLQHRETIVREREATFQLREGEVQQSEARVGQRETQVGQREDVVGQRESRVEQREVSIQQHETTGQNFETRVLQGEARVQHRETAIRLRETAVQERETKVQHVENIQETEIAVQQRESHVHQREIASTARDSLLTERETSLTARENLLAEHTISLDQRQQLQETELQSKLSAMTQREQRIKYLEDWLVLRQDYAKEELSTLWKLQVAQIVNELDLESRESALQESRTRIDQRENGLYGMERRLNEMQQRLRRDKQAYDAMLHVRLKRWLRPNSASR